MSYKKFCANESCPKHNNLISNHGMFCGECAAPLVTEFNGVGLGVAEEDLLKWVSYNAFMSWMRGQTNALVDGHNVFYWDDINRFLKRLPIID